MSRSPRSTQCIQHCRGAMRDLEAALRLAHVYGPASSLTLQLRVDALRTIIADMEARHRSIAVSEVHAAKRARLDKRLRMRAVRAAGLDRANEAPVRPSSSRSPITTELTELNRARLNLLHIQQSARRRMDAAAIPVLDKWREKTGKIAFRTAPLCVGGE